MSKECLTRYRAALKLGKSVPVNDEELAVKEDCMAWGANGEFLRKYQARECPADDDIEIMKELTASVCIRIIPHVITNGGSLTTDMGELMDNPILSIYGNSK